MNIIVKYCLFAFTLMSLNIISCQHNNLNSTNYIFSGRVEHLDYDKTILISSGSSVSFKFIGSNCEVSLMNVDSYDHHNYVSLELDGKYIGRIKIDKGASKLYPINVNKNEINKIHNLTIYKSTEAANGGILFNGTTAKLKKNKYLKRKKIEFIGNSITCGMGNDLSDIPCKSGEWFDQHNAYWSYGAILSRILNTDFMLSSVSGIGVYRNWNNEHKEEPSMPDVYHNLYLNNDTSKPYLYNFNPDIISICLGTNDLSDGDGIKPRLPFDENIYCSSYINFIETFYKKYPNVQIVLLNSPMVSGEKNNTFLKCLEKIKNHFNTNKNAKKIKIFQFNSISPKGCDYHPDIDDHIEMANQIKDFFKALLNEDK